MGKGIGPGLVAGTIRSAFTSTGWDADPSRIFGSVAGNVDETLDRVGSYATVFHAVFDPATGAGSYADAGQGLSHILRADNTIERLARTGPPLGLMPGQSWDHHAFILAPGDAILIPTDGLLDLHGGDLGLLAAALGGCRPHDPDTAVKKLCDRRGKRVILDDITAVLLQRGTITAAGRSRRSSCVPPSATRPGRMHRGQKPGTLGGSGESLAATAIESA